MTLTRTQIRAARRALAEYHRTGQLARGIRRCPAALSEPGDPVQLQCDLVAGHYPRTVHRHRIPSTSHIIEWPRRGAPRADRPE